MNLPLLITFAVLVPIVLIVVLFAAARGMVWLGVRPRVWAIVQIVLGLLYTAGGLWSGTGSVTNDVVFVIGGALFFLSGVYHWFRGEAINLE